LYKAIVGWTSLQERVERTLPGRVVISAFVVITVLTVVIANMPPSRLQDLLISADHPYLYGVALDQSWEVFAPDPRRETINVLGRVTYADGSTATWRVHRRNPVIGEYTDYRWLKWAEFVISPSYDELWRPAALYVARHMATPTKRPTHVELVNRYTQLQQPGEIKGPPPVLENPIYSTDITEAMLRKGTG
jgi:hypothetical protein